jgi:caffeoyl-CoA O-methyltransferase
MFHPISPAMQKRMRYLEFADAADRGDGTPRIRRLRQITPETGRFLAIMAANAPEGEIVELGTSAGYSTLWLTLAAKDRDQRIQTFEVDPRKAEIARETFAAAVVEDFVDLHMLDARQGLRSVDPIGFCFMDLDKEFYPDCYELILPKLAPGGLLIADNATSHASDLEAFLEQAHNDPRVDALIVPIGKGELVCRRALI